MRYCVLSLILAAFATGCGPSADPQPIEETRTGPSPSADPDLTTAARFGMTRSTGTPQAASSAQPQLFEWDMPEGWSELALTDLRFVNLAVGADYDEHGTECYVTILQGDGGGVDANINRWRGQMGLEPLSDTEIVALPTIRFLNRDALYLDVEGTYTGMQGSANIAEGRMLAAIFVAQGRAVTVKMAGPAAVVAREKENFERFVTSLRPAAPPAEPADQAAMDNGGTASAYSWTTPESWTAGPENAMRIATYLAGPEQSVEISVLTFPGDVGGIEANVNRWRSQVGAEPLDSAAIAALPTLTILGQASPYVEAEGTYTGMGDANIADGMLIGAICPLEDRSLFFKMTGPADAVKAERDKFVAFCESFQQ